MNRAERRAKEKGKKKETNKKVEAMAWLKSLPPTKQLLIDSLVKIEAKKENNNLIQAIDRCFSAAIIQEFENLEWADVERIIDISADLMLNDAEKMKKLKESFGGSYDMATKKINELGPEVEKRIRELINDGYNQKVSIKMLQEEFRDLSTAMLTNAFKKTKALVKDEQKAKDVANKIKDIMGEPDKEIEGALEYIFEDEIENKEVVKEGILTPEYLFTLLNKMDKGNFIITTEVGQHQMWTAQNYKFYKPRTFISSGGLGTMGFGMGASIGAQVANPKAVVFNIAGDGSFGMDCNEFATAVNFKIPVKVIVMNNNALGMVRQWQSLFYECRYAETTLNRATDFVKLAEAFGGTGFRVEKPEELQEVLEKALATDGPVIIDYKIDSDDMVFPMVAPGAPINEIISKEDIKL